MDYLGRFLEWKEIGSYGYFKKGVLRSYLRGLICIKKFICSFSYGLFYYIFKMF